jgi:hypothetical protein
MATRSVVHQHQLYAVLVIALFGVMVFFLLLATLQTPEGGQTVVRLMAALTVSHCC